MKRVTFVTLYAAAFLLLSAAVTELTGLIPFSTPWLPLIISFFIVLHNAFPAVIIKGDIRIRLPICSCVNSIALGFAIRAWCLYLHFENTVWEMLLGVLAVSAVLLLYYGISYIPFVDRHYAVFFWVLTVLVAAAYFVCIALLQSITLSTFGFYLIFILALAIVMCTPDGEDDEEKSKDSAEDGDKKDSEDAGKEAGKTEGKDAGKKEGKNEDIRDYVLYASFSVCLIVFLIPALILGDGSGLDGAGDYFVPRSPRRLEFLPGAEKRRPPAP